MEPIKVLYIVGGILNYGGIETFIMNYYRNIDKTKVQIDFVVNGYEKGVYDDEIQAVGGKIYYLPRRSKNFLGHIKELKKIYQSGQYKIVHVHANQMNGMFLKLAKKCNIPIRISHSHTANVVYDNKIKKIIYEFYKRKVKKYATDFWACSEIAGEWLYGKENIKNNKVVVIKNAIDLEKYIYNKDIRNKIRKEYGLKDEIVIGHIGRLYYEKNHKFIIELFEKYRKLNNNSRLVLIGEGALKQEIQNEIKEKKLEDSVIMIDKSNHINEILNMFDVFILPSLYEGLPFVAIEAQANGVPCVFSTNVTEELKIMDNVSFEPLNIDTWLKQIKLSTENNKRISDIGNMTEAGYNIKEEARKLEKKYIELYHNVDIEN